MRLENKPLVSLIRIWLHSCFPPVSLLTRLPSPAVRHPSDMSLILNLCILLYLSFFFSFSPRWSLWGQPYRAASYILEEEIGRLINQPKTCLQLCVTFLAQRKVISFPLLTGPYLEIWKDVTGVQGCSEHCFSTPVIENVRC